MSIENDTQQYIDANNYPCPCGSGRALINCCLTERVNTSPSSTQTEFSNPKCFARELYDCSQEMSKEHIVSKSVLKLIEIPNKPITISGPKWLNSGEEKSTSIASISTKILCKRHNEVLSGLDKIGQKFFDFLYNENNPDEYLFINGEEIERWMLKLLCGLISSGWGAKDLRYWQPPIEWLEILFGDGRIPERSGLYALKGKDIKTKYHQIGVSLLANDKRELIHGVYFFIAGFQFIFFMGPPKKDFLIRFLSSGWELHYRPECFVVVNGSKQREVHFGVSPRNGFVVMEVEPPQSTTCTSTT